MTYAPIVRRLMEMPPGWAEREMYRSSTGSISFGALREGMLHVAGWLGVEGLRPGDRVALCLPKSLETIQLIYGILAAGASYVGLPVQGPAARLRAMLDSIEPHLLLATPEVTAQLRRAEGGLPGSARMIEVGGERSIESLCRGIPPRASIADVSPDDLATIYFTSGSTGKPKGVMWSHRTMDLATRQMPRAVRMTEADRMISAAALHYSSAAEFFFSLQTGASTFVLSDQEVLFTDHIAATMERERISIWSGTATAWRLLVESGGLAARDLRSLRSITLYGERMPIPALREAMALLPHADFLNLYAASEAFFMVAYPVPRPLPDDIADLPLGYPGPDHALSLRDAEGHAVAPGEIGEICVVGPLVTMGYWREPELTAARRIDGRADSYRTGDHAYFDADGLLQLVGRTDQQVKLRGHRFELGEIETALKSHPSVREAVAFAIPAPDGETEIRAAVLAPDGRDAGDELRLLCRRLLPSFAQPSRIASLTAFPLLASGKIDRQALKALIAAN